MSPENAALIQRANVYELSEFYAILQGNQVD